MTMLRIRSVLALCLLAALLPSAAAAQGHGKGKGRQSDPVFSDRDRNIIGRYYAGSTANLPPGLAKRGGNLPPGLQKQLDRNGTLPPGLQKRLTPFPADLDRQLPPLPSIYQRGYIGEDVVIIERSTRRIIDIIRGVIRASR